MGEDTYIHIHKNVDMESNMNQIFVFAYISISFTLCLFILSMVSWVVSGVQDSGSKQKNTVLVWECTRGDQC